MEDWRREAAGVRVQKISRLLDRGLITEPEMVRAVVDRLEPDHISESLNICPDTIRNALQRFVELAPKSDGEWEKFRHFYIGPESAEALALAKIKFRRNTEALREFFRLVHDRPPIPPASFGR